jgi:hypothetical protein
MISFIEAEENSWSYDESLNWKVDFCIWILKLDGLKFPPFTHHSDGNCMLRNVGLDEETWHSWLEKVVASQDPCLLGATTPEECQTKLEEHLESFRRAKVALKLKISESNERERMERSLSTHLRQYELAAAKIAPFCGRCDPPNLWTGKSDVGNLLWTLWEQYVREYEEESFEYWQNNYEAPEMQSPWSSIVESLRDFFFSNQRNKRKLFWELKKYQKYFSSLNIYKVRYLSPVELPITPNSIIVSLDSEDRTGRKYYDRVLSATKSLVELASDSGR